MIKATAEHRMEKMWGSYVGKGLELPCPPWGTTLPAPPCVRQPQSSPNRRLLGFLRRLHHMDMVGYQLRIQPHISNSLLNGRELKIPSFYSGIGLSDDKPPSRNYSGAHQEFPYRRKMTAIN